ncbi:MAG TPA: porin family protein [Lentimicrobium sp.]|nr:porin family protein [Lentimicrobium sp.]
MKARHLLITIICLIIIVPSTALAQYRSFVLGVKAAPSISWLKSTQDRYNSEGAKIGFSWGVVSEFYFAKNYALATGINFIYQGGQLSYPDLKEDTEVTLFRDYRIQYLELPAVLKLKTNEMGKLKYFGQIGLGFGLRMNSKGKDEYTLNNQTVVDSKFKDIDDQTQIFRASMIIGAGIEYPIDNNTSAVIGVNFNNGFTNALKKNNIVTSYKHLGKPNFIELSLGVMF